MELTLEDRLGGRLGLLLGTGEPSDEFSLARGDRSRMGAKLLRAMADEHLLAPADVHRVIPRRTWVRRKAEGGLTPAEFDGLYRMVRLQLLAELVFQDREAARAWLHSPKARLRGEAPMQFAGDLLGFEAVENWLHEIDQGYLA
jgi:putative toxin-antitoxin system antitoxin component (TIGR02293 family)